MPINQLDVSKVLPAAQQYRANRLALQQEEEKRIDETKLRGLREQAFAGDQEAIGKIGVISPQAAAATQKILESIQMADDNQKARAFKNAQQMIGFATWADTPEKWEQGKKALSDIGIDLTDIGPYDENKRGYIVGFANKIKEISQGAEDRKTQLQEQTLEQRKSEFEFRKEQADIKAQELSPTTQKILDKAQTDAFQRQERAGKYRVLADNIKNARIQGGVFTTFNEFLKEQLGTQDEVTNFRREYLGVRAAQAVNNLPPGVASDKDIQLALSGFPSDKANSDQMESFLRGASKLEALNAAFETFKAEKISENKSTRHLLRDWRSKVYSSELGREVEMAEIYYTAANKGVSIEDVKDKLGIQ